MSHKYKILDQQKPYFVTFTVIQWIDLFIRNDYRDVIVSSIQYCQKQKGLEVYAWCIMTSHVHMILGTSGVNPLEYIIRDLKSFTSRTIRKLLEKKDGQESRHWMYEMMQEAGIANSNNKDFQLWQQHNHPVELYSENVFRQKLEYLHMNPVVAGFVDTPEAWLYSSACDYYSGKKD